MCDPGPSAQSGCSGGQPVHRVRVELNSASVTVTDNQAPTLAATAGGLFAAAGYQHGVLAGTISGADNSGVAGVRVYVDGNPVVQSAFNCDFTYAQPCPATATSRTLSLDTTRLADGPHVIQAAVVDAAGNETRGPVGPLLVANHPSAAPIGVAVTDAPTGWTNHPATLAWQNPPHGLGLPIAGVAWVACRGVDASLPASGCGAVHSQTTPLTSLAEDARTEPAFAGRLPDTYTVFVWLVEASGNLNPAAFGRASFGFDNTTPGPPAALSATPSATSGSFVVRATPPDHVAPITAIGWTACRTGGTCTTARTAAGSTFDFDPTTNPTFRSMPRGRYVVRAWLYDAAGNGDPASAASTTLSYPAAGSPKAARGVGRPLLRITAVAVHGRTLRVVGTASRALDGHVHIVEHYLVGSVAHVIRHTATAAAGRFSTRFAQPRGARADRLTVIFGGDRHFRAETVTRRLAKS